MFSRVLKNSQAYLYTLTMYPTTPCAYDNESLSALLETRILSKNPRYNYRTAVSGKRSSWIVCLGRARSIYQTCNSQPYLSPLRGPSRSVKTRRLLNFRYSWRDLDCSLLSVPSRLLLSDTEMCVHVCGRDISCSVYPCSL